MAKFMTAPMKSPVDELWLHHVPSGTVIEREEGGAARPSRASGLDLFPPSRLRERVGERASRGVVQDIGYREGTGHRLQV